MGRSCIINPKNCLYCSKVFNSPPSIKKKYCSFKCSCDIRKGKKGRKQSEESKEKNRVAHLGNKGRLGFKCSLERRQAMSITASGDKSPFWKGGVSLESARIRRSLKYRLWREAVLERDDFTCQKCGCKENPLAHHIKAFEDYPELRFDVDNGQTLCKKCHPRQTEKHKRNNQYTK